MLQIYVDKTDDTVMYNDSEFTKNTVAKVIEDEILRKNIEEIEQVHFIDASHIESKFNKQPLNLTEVSTGCKTYINILTHKDVPIYIGECGLNIMEKIYSLNEGKIYMPFLIVSLSDDINDKDFEVITKSRKYRVKGLIELSEIYEGEE